MRYRIIIEWIDSELARLEAVRGILAGSGQQSLLPARVESEAEMSPPQALEAQLAPERRAPAQPAKIRPKQTRLPRRRRAPVEPEIARALATSIPLGPVAVPAAGVPARAVAVAPKKPAGPNAEPVAEGTLEALVRDLQARQSFV